MNTTEYSKLVRDFLKYLDSLSSDALSSVIQGKMRITFILSDPGSLDKKSSALVGASHSTLIELLNKSRNREEAHSLLTDLTKVSLTSLAKCLDTPTQKTDTIERLRDKIIESTIGFRMRSEAIQTTNAEQTGTGQPATRPVVKPEGGEKPQPETEGALPVAGCQASTSDLKARNK